MRKLLVLCLFMVSAMAGWAQVEFKASAPAVVEQGEKFRLTFSINARGGDFQEPKFDGFNVLSGPNTSSSSSVQIVNGKMTQSVSFTYTYILLAQNEGKFTIPSTRIEVKGEAYESNALTIEVVKGKAQAATAPTPSSTVDKSNIADDRLFVAVNVDKKSLYQGEHLTATIKVYTKENLAGFEDIKFPAYTGFWSQDIETPQQITLTKENVNGEVYSVGVFKKSLLFPQRSGELTIDPFEITMLIQQRVRSNSAFDDFFGGSYRTLKKAVKSKPITIHVKPLPAKPTTFTGAVGQMTMVAAMDKQEVKTNEAVNLRIRISGNGNLKLIKPLAVDFPPDLDVYDPQTNLKTEAGASGVNGSVSFNYLFIPRFAGTYRIAPITFTYFDTQSKQYKTITTQEFVLNVARGEGEEAGPSGVVQGVSKEEVRYLGQDIRFIKTEVNLQKKSGFVFGTSLYYLILLGAFVLFVLLLLVRRNKIKQNADQAKMKNKKANKVSQKRLKVAASYMKNKEEEKFYDEVLKAIWGYLSDKLSIPVAELTKDNVEGILQQHAVDEHTTQELMDVLNNCEFARFAPSAVSGGTADIYKKAGALILKLDQKIK